MMFGKLKQLAIASVLAIATVTGGAAPTYAAKADIELLQSYIGDWRGRGNAKLASTGEDETVLCKMNFTKSSGSKIGLNGRCSLAGTTLSMRGTVGYVEAAKRFEAVMSSNTSFQGVAIGKRRGKNLTFKLNNVKSDSNDAFDIAVALELKGGTINVRFDILHKESGGKSFAIIPFKKN